MEVDLVDDLKSTIQFYLVVFITLMSGYVKLFREEYCNSFEVDPVAEKFIAISEKYSEMEHREKAKGRQANPI